MKCIVCSLFQKGLCMSYHNKQKKHQTHNNKCNCKDHSNHYEELCHKHKPSELNPKNIITSIDTDNTNNISNISELINVAELLSFLEDRYALLLKQHEVLTEKYNKLVNFVGETIWENQISHQLVALPLVNYSYKENNKYIDDYVVDKIISKNVHKNSVGVGNSNSYGENEEVHQYIACYKLLEPIIDKPLANSYRNSNNNNNNNDKIHQKQKYNVKHVVIKSYRKDKISSVNTLNRVNTEISTLRLLQGHKNIINVEKLMQTRNCINIVMTRMNIDLYDYVCLYKDKLDMLHAGGILHDILEGVAHMHSHGVIHRDLKSENVLLQVNKTTNKVIAKITDFGMSKLFPRLRIRLRESVDLTSVKSWSDKTDSARKGSYSIKRKQSLSKSVGNSLNGVNSNGKNNANRLDYRKASLAMSQHLLYFFNPENNDKDEDNNDDTTTSLSDATNIWFKPLLTPLPTNINHPVRLPSSYQKYPTDGVLNDFCGSVGFFAPEVFTTTEYCGYKADIFGVAAIVLEMLVSQKYYVNSWISIYDDHNRSESTIFEAAMKTGIRKALLEVQKSHPYMVLDFITRCLNYEPNYRPLSEELLKSQWMLHIAKLNKEEEDRLAREAAQEVLKLDEMKTQATEDAWRLRKWKEQFPSADTYYHQVGFLEEMEKPDDTVEHETEDKKIDASITENAPNLDPISIRAPTIHPLCVVEGDEQEQSDTDSGTESTDSSYDSKLTTSTQHALPFSTDKMLDRRATTALEIINSSSKTFLCEHTIASNSKIVLMPITTQRKRVCSTSQAVVTPSKEQQIAESRKKFVMQKKLKEFRQKHEYLEKRKTKKQKQNIVGDNCLPKKYRKNVLKRLQSDDDTVTNTTITAECVVVSCKPMN